MKENQRDEIREIERKQNAMEKKGEEIKQVCKQITEKQEKFDAR